MKVFLFNRKICLKAGITITRYGFMGLDLGVFWVYPWDKKGTTYRFKRIDIIYQSRG